MLAINRQAWGAQGFAKYTHGVGTGIALSLLGQLTMRRAKSYINNLPVINLCPA
jgi:hypothetical protein